MNYRQGNTSKSRGTGKNQKNGATSHGDATTAQEDVGGKNSWTGRPGPKEQSKANWNGKEGKFLSKSSHGGAGAKNKGGGSGSMSKYHTTSGWEQSQGQKQHGKYKNGSGKMNEWWHDDYEQDTAGHQYSTEQGTSRKGKGQHAAKFYSGFNKHQDYDAHSHSKSTFVDPTQSFNYDAGAAGHRMQGRAHATYKGEASSKANQENVSADNVRHTETNKGRQSGKNFSYAAFSSASYSDGTEVAQSSANISSSWHDENAHNSPEEIETCFRLVFQTLPALASIPEQELQDRKKQLQSAVNSEDFVQAAVLKEEVTELREKAADITNLVNIYALKPLEDEIENLATGSNSKTEFFTTKDDLARLFDSLAQHLKLLEKFVQTNFGLLEGGRAPAPEVLRSVEHYQPLPGRSSSAGTRTTPISAKEADLRRRLGGAIVAGGQRVLSTTLDENSASQFGSLSTSTGKNAVGGKQGSGGRKSNQPQSSTSSQRNSNYALEERLQKHREFFAVFQSEEEQIGKVNPGNKAKGNKGSSSSSKAPVSYASMVVAADNKKQKDLHAGRRVEEDTEVHEVTSYMTKKRPKFMKLSLILPAPGEGWEWRAAAPHVGRRDALARIATSAAYLSYGVPNLNVADIVFVFEDGSFLTFQPKDLVRSVPIPCEKKLIEYLAKVGRVVGAQTTNFSNSTRNKKSSEDGAKQTTPSPPSSTTNAGLTTALRNLIDSTTSASSRATSSTSSFCSLFLDENSCNLPSLSTMALADENLVLRALQQVEEQQTRVYKNEDTHGSKGKDKARKFKSSPSSVNNSSAIRNFDHCLVFLGAVRDITSSEKKECKAVLQEHKIPWVIARLGTQAEFTSKIVDILLAYNAYGKLANGIRNMHVWNSSTAGLQLVSGGSAGVRSSSKSSSASTTSTWDQLLLGYNAGGGATSSFVASRGNKDGTGKKPSRQLHGRKGKGAKQQSGTPEDVDDSSSGTSAPPSLSFVLGWMDLKTQEDAVYYIHRACVSHLWRSHGMNEKANAVSFLLPEQFSRNRVATTSEEQAGNNYKAVNNTSSRHLLAIYPKIVTNMNRQHRAAPTEGNLFLMLYAFFRSRGEALQSLRTRFAAPFENNWIAMRGKWENKAIELEVDDEIVEVVEEKEFLERASKGRDERKVIGDKSSAGSKNSSANYMMKTTLVLQLQLGDQHKTSVTSSKLTTREETTHDGEHNQVSSEILTLDPSVLLAGGGGGGKARAASSEVDDPATSAVFASVDKVVIVLQTIQREVTFPTFAVTSAPGAGSVYFDTEVVLHESEDHEQDPASTTSSRSGRIVKTVKNLRMPLMSHHAAIALLNSWHQENLLLPALEKMLKNST
ncbi:unnamed protein product [Amoebophrya sp. A120]|nr:unnamed protein product [Amoebophrya sp. A120]|eukprot:GSA120T00022341001.1